MAGLLADLPMTVLIAATLIATLAGFVKGAVGFALPMILISGLGSILPAETALAALILPTLLSNLWQSLRDGWRAAFAIVRRYWLFIAMMVVMLACSAQLVTLVPDTVLFLVIGVPIVLFALTQLAGWRLHLRPETRVRDELVLGGVSGFVGGMSGVWGPPLVAYLVAIDEAKRDAVRIQGVVFLVGAVILLVAHLHSGVLNPVTLPLSAAAIVPVFAGYALGSLVQNRLPQESFRRVVLVVLGLVGLNLIRRAMLG